jgi:hypothetical protein
MDIIHGHTRKVPDALSLETLAKIAVLVDFYECLEVVEMWSKIWVDKLRSTVPRDYSKDLMLWVCISWVFQQVEIFQKVTKVAMMHSTGSLRTMGLPIPERIVRKSLQDLLARINLSLALQVLSISGDRIILIMSLLNSMTSLMVFVRLTGCVVFHASWCAYQADESPKPLLSPARGSIYGVKYSFA